MVLDTQPSTRLWESSRGPDSVPFSGCNYIPAFVADPEALFGVVRDDVRWTEQMRSRKTASMGVPYNYAGARYPVADWHPAVERLGQLVAKKAGFEPTNCLLNYYPTGRHALGWHSDDVSILAPGTGIAIVSLGAARPLRLRCTTADGFHYEEQLLEPGSLLLMTAAMQASWKHALRRVATDGARISLSFRHIVRWEDHPEPLRPRWGESA